jgi:hypothetical protein
MIVTKVANRNPECRAVLQKNAARAPASKQKNLRREKIKADALLN